MLCMTRFMIVNHFLQIFGFLKPEDAQKCAKKECLK